MLRRCAVTAFQPRSVTAFQYGLLVRVVGVHARSGRTGAAMFSACPALGGCKPEHQRLVTRAPKHMGLARHGPSNAHRTCAAVVHPHRHAVAIVPVVVMCFTRVASDPMFFLFTELCSIGFPPFQPTRRSKNSRPSPGHVVVWQHASAQRVAGADRSRGDQWHVHQAWLPPSPATRARLHSSTTTLER